MINQSTLTEFLKFELDESIRAELLASIEDMNSGLRYFTYNTFNVLLDADTSKAIVEDELDAARRSEVSLEDFAKLLRDGSP